MPNGMPWSRVCFLESCFVLSSFMRSLNPYGLMFSTRIDGYKVGKLLTTLLCPKSTILCLLRLYKLFSPWSVILHPSALQWKMEF